MVVGISVVCKQYKHQKRVLQGLFSRDKDFAFLCNRGASSCHKEAAEKTYNMFCSSPDNLKFYVVRDGRSLVGYFATEYAASLNFLSGSFVSKKYRNKKDLHNYWENIKNILGPKFYASLPEINKKAISSYEKSGGKIIRDFQHNDEKYYLLEFGVL